MDNVSPKVIEEHGADKVREYITGGVGHETRQGRYDRGDGSFTAWVDVKSCHATYARKGWMLSELLSPEDARAIGEMRK